MKIAICEDQASCRKSLLTSVQRYCTENFWQAEIDTFQSGEDLLKAFLIQAYDIVLLDIYLDGISGIDTAAEIRKNNIECKIIFTTTSTEHMLNGFELNATHYLLKPISFDKLSQALLRCSTLLKTKDKYLEVISNKTSLKINLKNILYIDIYGNITTIHTFKDKIKTYLPLHKISEKIGEKPFLHCHRSYIVNMDYIININSDDFIMTNNDKVPIRKNNRSEITNQYYKYHFEKIRNQ